MAPSDKSTPAPKNPGTPSNSVPPPAEAPAKKKGAGRFVTPILAGVAVLAIGIFGGVLIGQNLSSSNAAGGRTAGGAGFGGGEGFGGQTGEGFPGGTSTNGPGAVAGGFTTGTVTANDDGTLTVTTQDGSTVTVTTTDDTTVTESTEGSVSDLATGDTVTIRGEADSDGNVAATSISEGDTGFGGFGGGQGGAPGTTGTDSGN